MQAEPLFPEPPFPSAHLSHLVLGLLSFPGRAITSTQRGDVCQAPELAPASCRELKGCSAAPRGDGTAKTTAGAAGIWPEVQHLFQPGKTVLERQGSPQIIRLGILMEKTQVLGFFPSLYYPSFSSYG